MKSSVFVAITGTKHYFGTEFIKPGQLICFVKDHDNPYDQEAIMAMLTPIGKIGYVANSPHTVPKGCRSAGRIYDTFDEQVFGVVRFVVKDTPIVELVENVEEIYIIKLTLHTAEAVGFLGAPRNREFCLAAPSDPRVSHG